MPKIMARHAPAPYGIIGPSYLGPISNVGPNYLGPI